MKIYEFLYSPCIHEDVYETVSLHRTLKGAKNALKKHKAKELQEYNRLFKGKEIECSGMKFGQHEGWDVAEVELQD